MKYLHEIIIETIEGLIAEGEPFSAWDVTQEVREFVYDFSPGEISDCTTFTDKLGEETYNIEHSRVKNLVHLFLKNYNPNKIQQAHGPKYITYTPVVLQDTFTPATSPVFDPLGWLTSPLVYPDVKLTADSVPPTRTTTYIDVGENKNNLSDDELIEAAKKILFKHLNAR